MWILRRSLLSWLAGFLLSLLLCGAHPLASARVTSLRAAVMPVQPRVDSLKNPVGLDSPAPELSWTLEVTDPAARNLSQSSYRILVASSPAVLAGNVGDLWDSGEIPAAAMHARYRGHPLRSHTAYWWKVRVRDQKGIPSGWTEPATWITALLSSGDWSAHWITAEQQGALAPMPLFRYQFSIARPVTQALVSVTGLGQYELTLNGDTVTDTVVNPGWTDYRKRILYETFDVSTLLRTGDNCFGVMLGNGMYNVPSVPGRYTKFVGSFGPPKLIVQMDVLYQDGTRQRIVSGEGWKTAPGPIVLSSVYGGEDYDARKQLAGWNTAGYDDSSWRAATEVSAAGNALSAQTIPPMRVLRTLQPVAITEPRPGVRVYDFGENSAGWPGITVRGRAGDSVKLTPGELLDAQGLVTQASADAGPGREVLFNYVLGGSEPEVWHPRFSYYGFRYLQVETSAASSTLADQPVVLAVEAQVIHDDVERTGQFSSSLPLLNRIHTLIDGAILSNLVSVLTDCPTREKLGWLEQTHLMGPSIMENFNVSRLYSKMADDMADAQLADGLVPSIAPEVVSFVDKEGRSTRFRDSPEWGSAVILSPWAAYEFYGDKALLAQHYDAMQRYAGYLRARSVKHLLLYGLGDWYDVGPRDPGDSQFTTTGLTATAIYYQDLCALAQIAKVLDHRRDAVLFAQESAAVKRAFNQQFFHPESNEYDRGSQTANAMPLALGLVPESRRAAVLDHLVDDIRSHNNHVTAGDIGFHYVVRALTGGDRPGVLLDMLMRTDAPSYGYQLAAGATTLTEAWDANPNHSQNHFMLGHAEEWLYRGLAGIDLDLSRAAPRQIIIRPAMSQTVHAASAQIESTLGTIGVAWVDSGSWSLTVQIPPGASATIYLPANEGSIVEGALPLRRAGVRRAFQSSQGVTAVEIGSGSYRFALRDPVDLKRPRKTR